jgi:hypothetical protein
VAIWVMCPEMLQRVRGAQEASIVRPARIALGQSA